MYRTLRFPLIILSLFAAFQTGFGQSFSTSEHYDQAYSLLLDLKFEEAAKRINQIRTNSENELSAVYLEDLSDFLYIVVSEDLAEFEKKKDLRSSRIRSLESLPHDSPYRLLAIGEVHLHWAFSKMRFGEYLSGAREINQAFKALEKNIERFPNFLPTYKSMGLLHTLVGTVPENYRWATNLMGVDGTIEQGISEMEKVIRESAGKSDLRNLRKETLFLLSFLHINLLNDRSALIRYQTEIEKEKGPLMDFALASLLKETGKTDAAIEVLVRSTKNGTAFPYLYFLLGEMKLARSDKDANVQFQNFIERFKGNSYMKAAHQKLAWYQLLSLGNTDGYKKAILKVSAVGNTMLDEDKAAQKECESGKKPNSVLLKSRLQFDGGYYVKALETLVKSNRNSFISEDENLEFVYRLGRIHDELGNQQEAITYYRLAMEKGANSTRYFAANSSLMLGLLYEDSGNRNEALKAFESCSTFKNTEYRNSINQKAKAGILRLQN